jgi:hypothetical protein
MDQNGLPLLFEPDAFGKPIPMQCPRCAVEHTNWEQSVPFDSHGDYVNIRSSFSNHVLSRNPAGAGGKDGGIHGESNNLALLSAPTTGPIAVASLNKTSSASGGGSVVATSSPAIPAILQAIGSVTYRDDEVVTLVQKKIVTGPLPKAYYCGKCSRRMQRVDQFGVLVPLEMDPYGNVVPMTCPGCKQTHAEWDTKVFHVGK